MWNYLDETGVCYHFSGSPPDLVPAKMSSRKGLRQNDYLRKSWSADKNPPTGSNNKGNKGYPAFRSS
jgi:hypothetical protein